MSFLSRAKKLLPEPLAEAARTLWHPLLATLAAIRSGFPTRSMTVVGINGTKGKSTTSDMLFAILTKAGHKTALASTIRFAIGDESEPNLFKMTMPGRGFLQHFLARARKQGATHAVVELTTEGARQWRHRFLSLDALVMLNVQREHLERFGSFEKYVAAKRWLVRELERSRKTNRAVVVCTEDAENASFLDAAVETKLPFSYHDLEQLSSDAHETRFTYRGTQFTIPLPGHFNALNALGAIRAAEHLGVPLSVSSQALAAMPQVKGRLEPVNRGQPFSVIVDYAHTPDSLRALYSAYPGRKICVLGNTGGGRDTWKRPEMGRIADEACAEVILTDEDPYDEDPRTILEEMARGMKRAPEIILDRRDAIRRALTVAAAGDTVLISGKGTDPYIMGKNGSKTPWSDAAVAAEELDLLLQKNVV